MDGKRVTFHYEGPAEEFYQVVKLLTDNRIPLLSVKHDSKTLEHLFLEVTKGDVK